ncbi:MAG: 16S rRNA (cytidine(1402)-2'-O)-methyltransferase [Candidatus Polarisedimenticolaceae bacterium]|nr:16S rRNA (cytidine(1402)-2'-O)-methyltransferase [Candidatus Polarisedimenticolaceae bacterium]
MSDQSGVLYVVATPIGNLDDMTPRAVQILKQVDLIAAEDTRHSGHLLRHFGINTPTYAVHEHNERDQFERLISRLQGGESLALISDAGTPLISDPGFHLVREARKAGVQVTPVPGVSALICALSAAGLPTDRFLFAGFPPRTASRRREWLQVLRGERATLVFYEASHRICASLQDMSEVFGAGREVVVARELSKMFETFLSGDLASVMQQISDDSNQQKGEFVVMLAGAAESDAEIEMAEAERVLRLLLAELPVKQAAALAAKITGQKKNGLYKLALSWQ